MNQNIIVPDIGDFESVEIIEVLVKVGDQIDKNDPVVTLESDKSSVEVPSPFSGKISDLKVKIGDKVSKGTLLAKIENNSSKNNIKAAEENTAKQKVSNLEVDKNIESVTKKNTKKDFAQSVSKDDVDPIETKEWIESLDAVIQNNGPSRASYLLNKVISMEEVLSKLEEK